MTYPLYYLYFNHVIILNNMSRAKKGFTVIELMVVISIISSLSSIVLAGLNTAKAKGRDSFRISQIKEVQKALAIYYSNHSNYPSNLYSFPLPSTEQIPESWSYMIQELSNEKLISARFSMNDSQIKLYPILIKTALASLGFTYYGCSIQDPLYRTGDDYSLSFGYAASADQKSYKIRVILENSNNPVLNNSYSGTFLDTSSTGITACDKSLKHYCVVSLL